MIYNLKNRKIIQISGVNAVSFINSLTTNNVLRLDNRKACYSTILTPTSRFLCDFFVYKQDENNLIIDIFEGFTHNFITLLNKYKLRSKFTINEITDLEIIACSESEIINDAEFYFKDTRSTNLGTRCIVKSQIYIASNDEQYDNFLIENKIPAGEWLETEKAFILEYNFEELKAIDFDKGCYIGQELVTRTKRTGEIRKELKLVNQKTLDQLECKIIKKHTVKDLYLILVKK